MSHINKIYQYEEFQLKTNNDDSSNRFESCEEIVDDIVSRGLVDSCDSLTLITKLTREYGLSYQEAKTCARLASALVGAENTQKEEKKEEKLYAQSGYFYPGYNQTTNTKNKNDGMDSLSSFGNYNRLMFGLR